jgi:hypothetical protein
MEVSSRRRGSALIANKKGAAAFAIAPVGAGGNDRYRVRLTRP